MSARGCQLAKYLLSRSRKRERGVKIVSFSKQPKRCLELAKGDAVLLVGSGGHAR